MSKKPKVSQVKVELNCPITVKDEGKDLEIETVTLRRLKVKDLRNLPEGCLSKDELDPMDALPLISVSSGLKTEWIEEFDLTDLDKIVRAMAPFLPRSQRTGKK